MDKQEYKQAKLVLEDGTTFAGYSFGYDSSTSGEVVFNTGMTGYPQSLTDPSYKGQILTLTYPLIGNYGIPENTVDEHNILKRFEANNIHVKALIISEYCQSYSHWNASRSLAEWLKNQQIPALFGIDTRALTKKIRSQGVMLGKVIINDQETEQYDPDTENQVAKVSTKQPQTYGTGKHKIILIDCGMKHNILREFLKRNTTCKVVPWDYDFTQEQFDGVFVSNGPGDPTFCKQTILHLQKTMQMQKPIFGICLGHQLLALAAGAKTYKLKFGHRSQNQPCIENGKAYITSQNHGFAVNATTLPNGWEEWFTNGNDNTNEGIRHKQLPFFSVQFHPEGYCGPQDTNFLFDKFIKVIEDA